MDAGRDGRGGGADARASRPRPVRLPRRQPRQLLPHDPERQGAQRDVAAGRGNGRARGDGDRGDGAGVGVDNATLWLQRLRLRRTVANPIWKT